MNKEDLEKQMKHYRKLNIRRFLKEHRDAIRELPAVQRHNFLRELKLFLAS